MKKKIEVPACFKAYDIRGRVPDELNPELARKIARTCSVVLKPKKIAIGQDMRLSSQDIVDALTAGFVEMGVDVQLLGLCGTEEIYHAAFSQEHNGLDGGIMVTASHNPADYNGLKIVTSGARPVTGDSGLNEIGAMIVNDRVPEAGTDRGRIFNCPEKAEYIKHLLGYVKPEQLHPLKLVVNSGNGCAGQVVDLLEDHLPFEFVKVHHTPDGTFPNGVPNPLLHDNREETSDLVRKHGADLGIAWDGDFDRCFFWDEQGNFIEGYYLVGLLALEILNQEPGGTILYDPRLVWNTEELVAGAGGKALITETGHAFIKQRMRKEDAVYGGEMSAHHYFRDFGYCDSGMVPWLLVCSLISRTGKPLSEFVRERIEAFPVSGEINNRVEDPDLVIQRVKEQYSDGKKEYIDGLSISYPEFRLNIRKSNTEPLLRLNVETRGDLDLLQKVTDDVLKLIKS